MDNEIRHRLEELVRAIGASEEYRTYEEARSRLELDPEKKKRANDFRRKNFQFQNFIGKLLFKLAVQFIDHIIADNRFIRVIQSFIQSLCSFSLWK